MSLNFFPLFRSKIRWLNVSFSIFSGRKAASSFFIICHDDQFLDGYAMSCLRQLFASGEMRTTLVLLNVSNVFFVDMTVCAWARNIVEINLCKIIRYLAAWVALSHHQPHFLSLKILWRRGQCKNRWSMFDDHKEIYLFSQTSST